VSLATPWEATEIQRWDASTGSVSAWASASGGDIALALDAMELRCLRVRPSTPSGCGPLRVSAQQADDTPAPAVQEVALDGGWTLEVFDQEDGRSRTVAISSERGWETQGLSAYSGLGVYRRTVTVPTDEDVEWTLVLPSVHTAVEVSLNGAPIGRRAWAPYVVPLTGLRHGDNALELRVYNTAGNRYLAKTPFRRQPAPSGLGATPVLRSVRPTHAA
jgi:hypothetical protein